MNNVNLRKYMLVKISLLRAVLSADPLLTLSVVFRMATLPKDLIEALQLSVPWTTFEAFAN